MAIIHEQQGEVIAFSYVGINIIGVLFFPAKKELCMLKSQAEKTRNLLSHLTS